MINVGIVEDNEKIRGLIQRYLDMQDELTCKAAMESVEDMLEYLEKEPEPDVLLMDIQLARYVRNRGDWYYQREVSGN